MSDEQQKKTAVDLYLRDTPAAGGANAYAEKLHYLFPRDLTESTTPDFVALRRKILHARNERRNARLKKLRWQLPVLAAAACVMVALGIRYVIGPDATNNTLAHKATNSLHMHSEAHRGSVNIFYRDANGVHSELKDKNLVVTASELTAVFSFSPNADVKRLTIRTPRAEVTVFGTEFIVDSREEVLLVAVKTGKVKVSLDGKEFYVSAGETLTERYAAGGDKTTAVARADVSLFENIRNPTHEWKTPAATEPPTTLENKTKPAQSVTLTLENGTTIKGFLEYEDSESLRLRVPAMGQVLTLKKSDILERR